MCYWLSLGIAATGLRSMSRHGNLSSLLGAFSGLRQMTREALGSPTGPIVLSLLNSSTQKEDTGWGDWSCNLTFLKVSVASAHLLPASEQAGIFVKSPRLHGLLFAYDRLIIRALYRPEAR